jgi:lactoylglutathione lyase
METGTGAAPLTDTSTVVPTPASVYQTLRPRRRRTRGRCLKLSPMIRLTALMPPSRPEEGDPTMTSRGRVPAARQQCAPASEPVRRIHHVGITVADLDRSLAFYRELLGMRVLGLSEAEDVGAIVGAPGATARIADLDAGAGQLLELLDYGSGPREGSGDGGPSTGPPPGPDTPGTCHVSLQVTDLRAVLARLASAGHPAMGEPIRLGGGGEEYEAGAHGASIAHDLWEDCTVVYLRDPDGVIVELLEHAPEATGPGHGASDG